MASSHRELRQLRRGTRDRMLLRPPITAYHWTAAHQPVKHILSLRVSDPVTIHRSPKSGHLDGSSAPCFAQMSRYPLKPVLLALHCSIYTAYTTAPAAAMVGISLPKDMMGPMPGQARHGEGCQCRNAEHGSMLETRRNRWHMLPHVCWQLCCFTVTDIFVILCGRMACPWAYWRGIVGSGWFRTLASSPAIDLHFWHENATRPLFTLCRNSTRMTWTVHTVLASAIIAFWGRVKKSLAIRTVAITVLARRKWKLNSWRALGYGEMHQILQPAHPRTS